MENEIMVKANSIIMQAQNPVVDQESYNQAAEIAKAIKALLKEADSIYDASIEAANKAHKAALALKKNETAPLIDADKIVRASMATWMNEQLRIQREAEQKARLEQMQAERKAAEERAAQAAALADLGLDEESKQVAEKPIEIKSVEPVKKVDTAGVLFRERWYPEIIDIAAIPREYMMPDMDKIKGMIASLKGATNIPGIRVMCEKTPVIR